MEKKIFIFGAGSVGSAIARSLAAKSVDKDSITIIVRDVESLKAKALAEEGFTVVLLPEADEREALFSNEDIVFFTAKLSGEGKATFLNQFRGKRYFSASATVISFTSGLKKQEIIGGLGFMPPRIICGTLSLGGPTLANMVLPVHCDRGIAEETLEVLRKLGTIVLLDSENQIVSCIGFVGAMRGIGFRIIRFIVDACTPFFGAMSFTKGARLVLLTLQACITGMLVKLDTLEEKGIPSAEAKGAFNTYFLAREKEVATKGGCTEAAFNQAKEEYLGPLLKRIIAACFNRLYEMVK